MPSPLTGHLYEILLDAINAGVWVWDIQTGEEWWSDKYYRLLGFEPGEIKASYHAFIYELVHPEDRRLLIDNNEQPIIVGVGTPVEVRLKLKSGAYKWYEATGKLMYDEHGRPVKMTGSIIDRNVSKALQAELQHSINVISEQNKRLNNFTNIVSHNLRSHSANIQAVLALIDGTPDKPASLAEPLLYLENISGALNQTIDHLAELVKTQTAFDLSRTPVRFKEVFDSVVMVLTPSIKKANARIEGDFAVCPEINYVYAYLESILLNLISNAVKYRHPDREPAIYLKTYKKENKVFLEIADNGQGIDLEKNGDKLFGLYNVFSTQPDSRGIGLYITRNQVESLGGNISVTSEPGNGCTFLVQF